MSIKKEYIFLLAIIIGASLYLYVKDTDRINYQLPELAKLNPAEMDTIEISRPGQDMLVLKKQAGRWRIQPEGYIADEEPVGKMLTAASALTVSTLVATSTDDDRYGLSPETAIAVCIKGEGDAVARRIVIGKKTTSHNHTFVKIDDDPGVYHADGRLEREFDTSVSSLRDKTVLAFTADDIRSISIVNRGKAIALEKRSASADQSVDPPGDGPTAGTDFQPEMVWVTARGEAADNEAVAVLLEDLSVLQCQKFLPESAKDDLTAPVYTITVSGTDEHALSLFPANTDDDAEDYRGVSSYAASPFVLTENTAADVMKTPADLTTSAENIEE